ncbi:MAG: hypothetical protein KDB58_13990, partial [Solirubrobacterales bacterium]|nr:hypothetical protein [Solirubrobacterales bacterium]
TGGTHMRRMRTATLVAVGMLVAAFAIAAPASAKDRNHDNLPDRWEKRYDLSLKVKQGKRDQDKDGLNNRGEYAAGTNPRKDDTDGDGSEDGDENAGVISAFDGETLTIDLYGGGSVTGTVDDSTEVKCGHECGQDGSSEESEGAERSPGPGGTEGGEEGGGHPGSGHPGEDECTVEDLAVDVVVREAELHLKNGSAVFDEIELAD